MPTWPSASAPQCTVTDPIVVIGGVNRALVDGNPFPNAPECIADITARYSHAVRQ